VSALGYHCLIRLNCSSGTGAGDDSPSIHSAPQEQPVCASICGPAICGDAQAPRRRQRDLSGSLRRSHSRRALSCDFVAREEAQAGRGAGEVVDGFTDRIDRRSVCRATSMAEESSRRNEARGDGRRLSFCGNFLSLGGIVAYDCLYVHVWPLERYLVTQTIAY
jgi:hypothetical protein